MKKIIYTLSLLTLCFFVEAATSRLRTIPGSSFVGKDPIITESPVFKQKIIYEGSSNTDLLVQAGKRLHITYEQYAENKNFVEIDFSKFEDEKYYIYYNMDGYAHRIVRAIKEGNQIQYKDTEITLYEKRYVIVEYTLNMSGSRDLASGELKKEKIALSHLTAPEHFSYNMFVRQSVPGEGRSKSTNDNVYLYTSFHRQGGPTGGQVSEKSYEDTLEAPADGYNRQFLHTIKEGECYVFRLLAFKSPDLYGKMRILKIQMDRPKDVAVVDYKIKMMKKSNKKAVDRTAGS